MSISDRFGPGTQGKIRYVARPRLLPSLSTRRVLNAIAEASPDFSGLRGVMPSAGSQAGPGSRS